MEELPAAPARVTLLRSLGSHRAAWDELVAEGRLPSPFVASWWLEASDPAALHLLLAFAGGDLIGGLALSCGQRGGVLTLALPGSSFSAPDHVDVLSRPGREDEVVEVLRRWFHDGEPYLLHGAGIPESSLLQRVLADDCRVVPFTTAPFLPLETSAPPQPISGRLRSTIRRAEKRLARRGLEHRRVPGTSTEFDRAIKSLVHMHKVMWPHGSRFLRGLPRLLPVLREGADAVEIHELLVDGRPVASMLMLIAGDRMSYYQSSRDVAHDLRGAGSVLMSRVITEGQARGHREFDFLRGQEPYKFDWTDRQRPLVRLFAARGAAPRMALAALLARERAKPALRRVRSILRSTTRAMARP